MFVAAVIEPAFVAAILSALYISCKSPMTDVSPTVSRKKKVSTVVERIIRSNGIARRRRPNLMNQQNSEIRIPHKKTDYPNQKVKRNKSSYKKAICNKWFFWIPIWLSWMPISNIVTKNALSLILEHFNRMEVPNTSCFCRKGTFLVERVLKWVIFSHIPGVLETTGL